MTRFTPMTALVVGVLALVPPSAGAWASYGSAEPSTHYDRDAGYMFTDGPTTEGNRVYLNMFYAEEGALAPNSATLQGHTSTVGPGSFTGFFGVWVDCNHDGYIGLADGALYEYTPDESAALGSPVDVTLCPSLTDDASNAGVIHNGNNWVTELVPIAPRNETQQTTANNWRVINDADAAIWGDRVQPVTPTAPPRDGCSQVSVTPVFGHGATSHTGGMLQQVDCLESVLGPMSFDGAQRFLASKDPTGTIASGPKPSSLWANGGVLDITTFGSDESSHSFVRGEQDCSQDPLVDLGAASPANAGRGVRSPGSIDVNPDGSIAGTINETHEESAADDCDTQDDGGNDLYGQYPVESASSAGGLSASGKNAAQMTFAFSGQPRQTCVGKTTWESLVAPNWPTAAGPAPADPIPGDPKIPTPRCGSPNAMGVAPSTVLLTSDLWRMTFNYANTAPAIVRANVDNPSPDFFPGDWYTFYARTHTTGVSLPHPTSGTYGIEWCTSGIGHGAGIQHGWDCDPANWNLDPATGRKVATASRLGNVGDDYQLRDTDCFDTTLVGAGSSANPFEQDIGARTVPGVASTSGGCS